MISPECRRLLEILREVYRTDAPAREQRLSPEDRLRLHQEQSGPRMAASSRSKSATSWPSHRHRPAQSHASLGHFPYPFPERSSTQRETETGNAAARTPTVTPRPESGTTSEPDCEPEHRSNRPCLESAIKGI
jgi:hypothetical protein